VRSRGEPAEPEVGAQQGLPDDEARIGNIHLSRNCRQPLIGRHLIEHQHSRRIPRKRTVSERIHNPHPHTGHQPTLPQHRSSHKRSGVIPEHWPSRVLDVKRSHDRIGRMGRCVVPIIFSTLALSACAGGSSASAPRPSSIDLGVACRVGGQTSCGRVGLAVWLPRVADRVTARAFAQTVRLSTSHSGSGRYGYRRYWVGFAKVVPTQLHPAGHVRVRITTTLGASTAAASRTAFLSAGWG
jgi:hypothetical protein